jgi:hypothetical protein
MSDNASRLLTIVRELKPTLDEFKCAPMELIEETMKSLRIYGLTHKDVAKAIRVYTGVEYTACDDNFAPCVLTRNPCTIYLHPSRVHDDFKDRYESWLTAIVNAWLRKLDRYKEQM